MQITITIIILVTTLYFLTQLYHYKFQNRALWFPSPPHIRQAIINHLELQPGQIFAELGAGTGTLSRLLAQKYPTNQIYAYEISYPPFLLGSLLAGRHPNLNFISGNLIKADLNMVDYFFVFTNDESMAQLATKLQKHPKAATLYSYRFQLPNHQASQIITTTKHPIYIYQL
jgi:hypothetical protein